MDYVTSGAKALIDRTGELIRGTFKGSEKLRDAHACLARLASLIRPLCASQAVGASVDPAVNTQPPWSPGSFERLHRR